MVSELGWSIPLEFPNFKKKKKIHSHHREAARWCTTSQIWTVSPPTSCTSSKYLPVGQEPNQVLQSFFFFWNPSLFSLSWPCQRALVLMNACYSHKTQQNLPSPNLIRVPKPIQVSVKTQMKPKATINLAKTLVLDPPFMVPLMPQQPSLSKPSCKLVFIDAKPNKTCCVVHDLQHVHHVCFASDNNETDHQSWILWALTPPNLLPISQ